MRMKIRRLYYHTLSWLEDKWPLGLMVIASIATLIFVTGLVRQPVFIAWGQTPVKEMRIQDLLTMLIIAKLIFYDWSHKK